LCWLFFAMLLSDHQLFSFRLEAFKYMMQLKWLLLHFVLVPLTRHLDRIGLSISIDKKNSSCRLLTLWFFFCPSWLVIPLFFGTWLYTSALAVRVLLRSLCCGWCSGLR
jgi:hypothetical protein